MTALPDEDWSASPSSQWTPSSTTPALPADFQEPDPRTFWLHARRHRVSFQLLKWMVFSIGVLAQTVVLAVGLSAPCGYFDERVLFDKRHFEGMAIVTIAFLLYCSRIQHFGPYAYTRGFINAGHALYLMLRRAVRCGLALAAGFFAHAEAVRRGLDLTRVEDVWKSVGIWLGAVALVYLLVRPLFHAAARGPLSFLFPPRRELNPGRPALWRDPAELRRPPV